MSYQKKEDQQIYAEITNPIHGGLGWGLGYCLWVPKRDISGGDTWAIMREVKPNDLIVHLVKRKETEGYKFCGVSLVKKSFKEVNFEPPKPGDYRGMNPFYRIELSNYMAFDNEIPVSTFFKEYNSQLHKIYNDIKRNNNSTFYVEYGDKKELRMSQKYLTHIPEELFGLIKDLFEERGLEYKVDENQVEKEGGTTRNEPFQSDWKVPDRVPSNISRIIRDNELTRKVKEKENYECQICGKKILLPNGNYYAEGHHLQPLGGDYKGPDIKENILVLCPNHHIEFDYGSIAIEPKSKTIKHINPKNSYHGEKLRSHRKYYGEEFLRFHFDEIYNQL